MLLVPVMAAVRQQTDALVPEDILGHISGLFLGF